MPTKGYVSVGIPRELAELVDTFLADDRLKRRNRNQFVVDAIRHYLPIARKEEERLLDTVRR
jgi:metal-responsive CopG/Arc/MetJ family transcriptional regulator